MLPIYSVLINMILIYAFLINVGEASLNLLAQERGFQLEMYQEMVTVCSGSTTEQSWYPTW